MDPETLFPFLLWSSNDRIYKTFYGDRGGREGE